MGLLSQEALKIVEEKIYVMVYEKEEKVRKSGFYVFTLSLGLLTLVWPQGHFITFEVFLHFIVCSANANR